MLAGVPHPSNSPPTTTRKEIFGENRLPPAPTKSIFELMLLAAQDKTMILLTVAAVISLVFGLLQDFVPALHNPDEPPVHWVGQSPLVRARTLICRRVKANAPSCWISTEGCAILVAVMVVILAGSINDYQKEKQFRKLSQVKDDRMVVVLRSGIIKEISVYDVVVGDIGTLEPGDVLAVDGVLLSSSGNLKVDESAATGESDAIKKSPVPQGEKHWDPFILSGGKVLEGTGRFIVCAVGIRSYFGRTMMGEFFAFDVGLLLFSQTILRLQHSVLSPPRPRFRSSSMVSPSGLPSSVPPQRSSCSSSSVSSTSSPSLLSKAKALDRIAWHRNVLPRPSRGSLALSSRRSRSLSSRSRKDCRWLSRSVWPTGR